MFPSLCVNSIQATPNMIILTAVYLCVAVHIVQSSEENANTTTLYPINKTIDYKDSEEVTNITNAPITNDKSTEINSVKNAITDIEKPSNKSEGSKVNSKSETATWKVDAVLSPPTQGSNKVWTSFKEKPDASKEFKPSQQLGHFYDEDALIASTVSSRDSFVPIKTTSSFIGSNEFVKLQYKTTKDFSKAQPYKFENSFSKAKAPPEGYDSKPTVEVPVKIPAGSLYKYQDPFKEKPGDGGDDFGLDFSGDKDKEVKKRKNPWHGLLNLVTALIPIGILVSALTPSIVTLQTTDNNQHFGNHFLRRSDLNLPKISERCKRRLLCEIHSERHYIRRQAARQKHCYKIECEDPDAMNKLLSWLLTYHRYPDMNY